MHAQCHIPGHSITRLEAQPSSPLFPGPLLLLPLCPRGLQCFHREFFVYFGHTALQHAGPQGQGSNQYRPTLRHLLAAAGLLCASSYSPSPWHQSPHQSSSEPYFICPFQRLATQQGGGSTHTHTHTHTHTSLTHTHITHTHPFLHFSRILISWDVRRSQNLAFHLKMRYHFLLLTASPGQSGEFNVCSSE